MTFEDELELFRKEAGAASQFLYASLALNALASEHRRVLDRLNDAPLFWNTTIFALQKSAILALGRVFQTDTNHNAARLLGAASELSVFSREALAQRRQGTLATRPEWVDDYVKNSYEPVPEDIRNLRRQVDAWRVVYDERYKPLRNKGYAHREFATDSDDWQGLVAKTQVAELERMCTFLLDLHEALRELFNNGRKPDVKESEYSIIEMLHAERLSDSPPEIIIRELKEFFSDEIAVDEKPAPEKRP